MAKSIAFAADVWFAIGCARLQARGSMMFTSVMSVLPRSRPALPSTWHARP